MMYLIIHFIAGRTCANEYLLTKHLQIHEGLEDLQESAAKTEPTQQDDKAASGMLGAEVTSNMTVKPKPPRYSPIPSITIQLFFRN